MTLKTSFAESPTPQSAAGPGRAPAHDRSRIAVVGYGEGDGRLHAQRLRDHGHDVTVALLPGGMSWVNAVKDGFRPLRAWEAVVGADVIVLLVPDEDVELVYFEQVAPLIREGALLVFAQENDLDSDQLVPGVDVAVIAMNGDGCSVSIRQDATGDARSRALTYLQWLGSEVPRPCSSHVRIHDASDPFPHPMRRTL